MTLLEECRRRGYLPELQRGRLYCKPWPPAPAFPGWAKVHKRRIVDELLMVPEDAVLDDMETARLARLSEDLYEYLRYAEDENRLRFLSSYSLVSRELERREASAAAIQGSLA